MDGPAAGSPLAREEAALEHAHPDWGRHQALDAGIAAGRLLDAAGRHLQGVAALFEARRAVLAPWAVVRAELEIISRASWILDPDIDGEARVARCWLERLNGTYRRKLSLDGMRAGQGAVKAARRDRDRVVAEINRRFPDATTHIPPTDQEPRWDIGGQTIPGLGETVNSFASRHLRARRLYDGLSYGSHPNLARLDLVAAPVAIDGHLEFPYVINEEELRWLAALAALAFYRGAWLCCSYFGHDGADLETWADQAQELAPQFFASHPS